MSGWTKAVTLSVLLFALFVIEPPTSFMDAAWRIVLPFGAWYLAEALSKMLRRRMVV